MTATLAHPPILTPEPATPPPASSLRRQKLAEYGHWFLYMGLTVRDLAADRDPLFREMAAALEAQPWTP